VYCVTCSDSSSYLQIHLDNDHQGPTVGLRASDENPRSPEAHLFLYPGMKCKGKTDIIIRQPNWHSDTLEGTKFKHTSSIDDRVHLHSLHGTSGNFDGHLSNGLLPVGLVIVQKPKLLSLPSNRHDVISQLYSIPVLETFSTKNYPQNGQHKSGLKKRSWRDEVLEDVVYY